MRTVIKKTNNNREIEIETDEREYSKPNDYCNNHYDDVEFKIDISKEDTEREGNK